jgi:hypothetical protein
VFAPRTQRRLKVLFLGGRLIAIVCAIAITSIGVESNGHKDGRGPLAGPMTVLTDLQLDDDPEPPSAKLAHPPKQTFGRPIHLV